MDVNMYMCVREREGKSVCVYACARMCVCVCVFAWEREDVCVLVCTCVYVYVHVCVRHLLMHMRKALFKRHQHVGRVSLRSFWGIVLPKFSKVSITAILCMTLGSELTFWNVYLARMVRAVRIEEDIDDSDEPEYVNYLLQCVAASCSVLQCASVCFIGIEEIIDNSDEPAHKYVYIYTYTNIYLYVYILGSSISRTGRKTFQFKCQMLNLTSI